MAEVTVGKQAYRVGRIAPYKQFHLVRRLSPAVFALGKVADSAKSLLAEPSKVNGEVPLLASLKDLRLGELLGTFEPVALALAQMSDADTEYVLNVCLDACQRQVSAEVWQPVRAPNGKLMFDDLGMQEMLQLAFEAIKENLGNFFLGPPPES
jgi:hypothetical protein